MLRRVVYDSALKGDFSRLLDANEWKAIDAGGIEDEGSDAEESEWRRLPQGHFQQFLLHDVA